MTICFVFDCNHQGLRKTCKMFRFPTSLALAKKWEKLCRRKDRSMIPQNDRICSCHFVDGEKRNGPTLFPWSCGKMFNFPDPSKINSLSRTEKKEIKEKAVSEDQCESTAMSCQPLHVSLDHTYQASYHQLKEENQNLRREVEELRIQVRMMSTKRAFRIGDIISEERKMLMYTSLRPDMFLAIDEMMQRFQIKYIDGWTPSFISLTDQLLMTLMKLTMNTPFLDLAERFNTSASSVNNIVTSQICALHEVLYEGLVESRIPSLQKCKGSMPISFGDFSSCRIVLDATEITQDVPGNDMRLQASTYSGYKNSHTVKSVTGVAPNGALVFISKLYPGSTSDVAIVEHCKVLEQLAPGDMILADKGFTIHKLLPQGVHLNIPPFLTSKSQYTPSEVQLCRKIAKSRIHVERANERIKNYEILRHVPQQFRYISTKVFQLCCVLVNFQDPLMQEIAQNFASVDN